MHKRGWIRERRFASATTSRRQFPDVPRGLYVHFGKILVFIVHRVHSSSSELYKCPKGEHMVKVANEDGRIDKKGFLLNMELLSRFWTV